MLIGLLQRFQESWHWLPLNKNEVLVVRIWYICISSEKISIEVKRELGLRKGRHAIGTSFFFF